VSAAESFQNRIVDLRAVARSSLIVNPTCAQVDATSAKADSFDASPDLSNFMISRVNNPLVALDEKNSQGLLVVAVEGVTSFELTNSPYLAAKSFGRAQIEKVKVWLRRKVAAAVILDAALIRYCPR
jgi:hypothetical protein